MAEERHRTQSERCEAAAEAALAAAGTECLRHSVGEVAGELEELSDVTVDTAGLHSDGDFSFIDLLLPNQGNDEVFNLLHRNGFTVQDAEGLPAHDELRLAVTAERPERQLAPGLDD